MRLNYKIVIAMLVLAIFAVGSVSAAEVVADDVIDDSVDDVVIDDVPLSDSVQDEDDTIYDEIQTTRGYDVNDSMDSDTINRYINTTSTGSGVVNFTPGTYKSMALVLKDNVALYGNGATIYGNGTDNVFTITGKSNFTITGFNIIVNSTQKAAIYGSNVFNVAITDNTITGGKDGINIFKTYENVTITGNTISGVTRDAISLVNHKTFSDSEWSNWPSSVVSNNNITGGQYAMFFGGNFKGTISGNTITNSDYGMQFAGKKNETNGKLHANIYGNTMTGVQTGIDMNHPSVVYLDIYLNNIVTANPTVNYAISCNSYFINGTHSQMYVFLNNLNGLVKQSFISKCTLFYPNTNYIIVP